MTQTCCPHSPGRKAGGGRAAIWVEPRTFGGRNDSSDPGAWDPVRPGRGGARWVGDAEPPHWWPEPPAHSAPADALVSTAAAGGGSEDTVGSAPARTCSALGHVEGDPCRQGGNACPPGTWPGNSAPPPLCSGWKLHLRGRDAHSPSLWHE